MVSKKKYTLKRILIIIIAALIAFCAISLIATKIIYDNIFSRYDTVAVVSPELAETVTARQEKEYYSGTNKLCGYLYRSNAETPHDGLIVIAPGHNAGADDYLWQIKSFLDYGWSVFAFDATGTCHSEGESAVGFAQILIDTEETIKYIEKNDRFGYNELVLFGHSRGGYAACCALGFDYDISAVVSVSGINSAMEGVIGSASQYVGPLAYGNYGGLWAYQTMLFGSDVVNMTAEEEISESNVPVLIVHGQNDNSFPTDKYSIISYRDEINSDAVEYIVCSEPGQDGHTNLLFEPDGTANDTLMSEINDFLLRNVE